MTAREQRRLRTVHRRAADGFGSADFVHARTRHSLLERLQWAALQPAVVLDLGAGQCPAADELRHRYPDARILAVDHAPEMLAKTAGVERVCAEATRLPLPDASVDLIFCNLMLAYCRDPAPILAEVRRILAPHGLFSFTTLGQESFRELRAAWSGLDRFVHLPPHPDMHSLGTLLQQAGLVETVLDSDYISVSYQDFSRLAVDLRAVGSANHSPRRNPGLTGRTSYHRLVESANRMRGSDGRFAVTLQIVYGLSWAAQRQHAGPEQEFSVPLSTLSRHRPDQDPQ